MAAYKLRVSLNLEKMVPSLPEHFTKIMILALRFFEETLRCFGMSDPILSRIFIVTSKTSIVTEG